METYKALRRNMVDCQLRPNDITDLRILAAMDDVPREAFVPDHVKSVAYADKDLPIIGRDQSGGPRAMMTAQALATLIQSADISPSDFVLDVGCLTGYSSAVLAHLADSVVALESLPDMVTSATDTLTDLQIMNVAVVEGGLLDGQEKQGPYDVILINGAVETVPEALLSQLKDGGRLVTVVIENGYGRAERFVKSGGVVGSVKIADLSAPVLSEFTKPEAFVF